MPRSSFSELDGEMFFSFFGIHPKQQQPASWNSYILSYYSYILSYSQFIHTPWNRQLHHCVSGLNLHTIILKIYLANRNLKTCQFLQLDAIKKWNAATLSTLSFNTGFTSIVCNWKKVQCHKFVEDNETVSPDKISKVRSLLLGHFKSPNMQVAWFGTKCKTQNKAILAYNADPETLLLKF